MDQDPRILGDEVKRIRRRLELSRVHLAERACLNLATIAGLEAGRGTVASLNTTLAAIGSRFSTHYDPDTSFGLHIAERRRKLGLSLDRLARISGISKPSLTQVEAGRGHVATLCAVLAALRLPIALVPASAPTPVQRLPAVPRSTVRRVIAGDCITQMPDLSSACADLVITSPPYNVGKTYEQRHSIEEYTAFAAAWVGCIPRILTPNGAFWLNVGFTTLPSGEALPLAYVYHPIAQRHGFKLVQELVWRYEGGMAYRRRFSVRTERWLWFVRDLSNYEFRLDHVRDPLANRTNDRRNNVLGRNPTDCWEFDRVVGGRGAGSDKTSHPCQTPVPMIERILAVSSRVGDVVLDPFAGAGSVAIAASRMGRGFVAIERDATFVGEMNARLEGAGEGAALHYGSIRVASNHSKRAGPT